MVSAYMFSLYTKIIVVDLQLPSILKYVDDIAIIALITNPEEDETHPLVSTRLSRCDLNTHFSLSDLSELSKYLVSPGHNTIHIELFY